MKLKDFLVKHSFKMIIFFTNQDMNDLIEANNTDEDEIKRLIEESDFKDELEAEYYISNIYPNSYFDDKFDIVLSKCIEDEDIYYQINILINSLCRNYKPYIKSSNSHKLFHILDDTKYCPLCELYDDNNFIIKSFISIFGYYIRISKQDEICRLCSNPIVELANRLYWMNYCLYNSSNFYLINNINDHRLSYNDLRYFCASADFLPIVDTSNISIEKCIDFVLNSNNNISYYDPLKFIGKLQLCDNKIYIDKTCGIIPYTIKTIVNPYLDLDHVLTPEMFYKLTHDIIYPDSIYIFSKTFNTELNLQIYDGKDGSKTFIITKSSYNKEIECMCTCKDSRFIFIFQ